MKKIIIAILLFFLAVFFMIRSTFSDVIINKYPDYQSVVDNNATDHGWVPAILPKSAYEIAETHDLDSNQLFGSFNYKEPDEKKLLSQLTVMPDMNETMEWGNFLFKIDKAHNHVKYRNKADLPRKKN